MKGSTPRHLKKYVSKCLRLKAYSQSPGDGRRAERIPAAPLRWALFMGVLLRRTAFAALEALVDSRARALGVSRRFGDDALAYFTERLDPAMTLERLYRIRYLHRGTHPVLSAISLWQLLWLSLSRPVPNDTN